MVLDGMEPRVMAPQSQLDDLLLLRLGDRHHRDEFGLLMSTSLSVPLE